MNEQLEKRKKGLLIPKPCPHCKADINYYEALHVDHTDLNYCPHCENQIVYSMEIYPSIKWEWAEPTY